MFSCGLYVCAGCFVALVGSFTCCLTLHLHVMGVPKGLPMSYTDSSRQEDAGLPTAFGRGPAEPRIQHRGISRAPQAGEEDDKAGVRQNQEDAEPDRSTPADEPEPVDPAAYDAMTPKQKKLFDLRLKLVSSIYYIQLYKS